ncbi:single-stranded-DNA-specific exonuclease RecJ [Bacteroidia bacterium]|nr:single-stranded-DNA-specific exonuclease RecJ [Bacteroidia bacterium]
MTEKRWILPQEEDTTIEKIQVLSNILATNNVPLNTIIAQLLVQRNVTDFDAAKSFFRPQLSDLHNPFLMQDMDKAVARVEEALTQHQKIMVYGDYDVDGTTAVALVYAFLKEEGADVTYEIPNRYIDGYGIAYRVIDKAAAAGVDLMIALDCGIKAVEKIDYAAGKGIDFIVCDHHLPDKEIPRAAAVLDPQRLDCNYPYKGLSGCGVGFKLLQAYCQKNNVPFERLEAMLDLVVVSIASDLVPITGENRVLAHYGLQRLNTSPRKGLQSIIDISVLNNQTITISDIVFRLGPRLNAAGRMDTGATSVDLLLAESDELAKIIGKTVNTQNNHRKNLDRSITVEAIAAVRREPAWHNKHSIVAFNPDWHKGVLGIVASRLVEEFYRPSVVLTVSNGVATGSARSIAGFDLYSAIESCSDLLTNFGGHLYAAGLTMPVDNVAKFSERFERIAQKKLLPQMLIPQINVDAKIEFTDITEQFCRILKQFQPFGPDNMAPVFVTHKVFCNGNIRTVGSTAEHLKMELMQEKFSSHTMSAIGFDFSDFYSYIAGGNPIDICYSIEENTFQGKTTLQLQIKDIKKSAS